MSDDLNRALARVESRQEQFAAEMQALDGRIDRLFDVIAEISGGLAVVTSMATDNRKQAAANKKKLVKPLVLFNAFSRHWKSFGSDFID